MESECMITLDEIISSVLTGGGTTRSRLACSLTLPHGKACHTCRCRGVPQNSFQN